MNKPLTELQERILDATHVETTVNYLGLSVLPLRFLLGRDWKKLRRELDDLIARGLLIEQGVSEMVSRRPWYVALKQKHLSYAPRRGLGVDKTRHQIPLLRIWIYIY